MLNLQTCWKKWAQLLNADGCCSSFVLFNSSAVSGMKTAYSELNFSVSARFHRASSPVFGMSLCQEIEWGHAGGGSVRLRLLQQTEMQGQAAKISLLARISPGVWKTLAASRPHLFPVALSVSGLLTFTQDIYLGINEELKMSLFSDKCSFYVFALLFSFFLQCSFIHPVWAIRLTKFLCKFSTLLLPLLVRLIICLQPRLFPNA